MTHKEYNIQTYNTFLYTMTISGLKLCHELPCSVLKDAAEGVKASWFSHHLTQHPLAAVLRHHAQEPEVEFQLLQSLANLKQD
jgi:hypothetical protein